MKKSEYKKKITKPPKKVITQEEFIFPEISEQKSGGFKFELYKVSESEKEDIKKRVLNENSKKYMEKEFRNLTTKEKLSLTQKSKPIIEKEILQTSITKSYQKLRGYYLETLTDFKAEVEIYIDIMSKVDLTMEEQMEYIDLILEMHTLLSGFQNLLQDNENKYDQVTNHKVSESFKELLDNYQLLTKRANKLTQKIKSRQPI
jgi:hypothetical protein